METIWEADITGSNTYKTYKTDTSGIPIKENDILYFIVGLSQFDLDFNLILTTVVIQFLPESPNSALNLALYVIIGSLGAILVLVI
ncbi:26596_t:CDS:1, partial [Gigaspora margarita]